MHHFPRCHDESLSDEDRLESVRVVFFAPGNDPSSWLDGWYPDASAIAAAMQQSDPGEWALAGKAPILIVHPLEDAMLPREADREFAMQLGDRAHYVELARCGHALLPEQPAMVANVLVAFFEANA